MKVPEVCNANMTTLPIAIVHSLVKSQPVFKRESSNIFCRSGER